MSLTYQQRIARVEQILASENVKTGKDKTHFDLAVKVLHALDTIKETIR